MDANERTPARWDNATAAAMLKIVAHYVGKHSQDDCPAPLSREGREEIVARIMFDIVTGEDIPDGIPIVRGVFRKARWWRIRGWCGDVELDRERKRTAAARERDERATPGSESFERAANKSEFRGYSDDSRQPTPLAIVIAAETAEREGLRYVSDRQAKQRRRAVKGHRRAIVRTVPGEIVGILTIDTDTGSWRYGEGACQRVEFRREDGGPVSGKRGRSHVGTIDNRAIGKTRTVPVSEGLAHWALLGRNERRRFTPAPLPMAGVPATAGDGTEWRPLQD